MFHFIYIPHPLYLCLSETLAFDCFYFLCMLHTFLFLCMRHRSSERLSVISNSLQPPWNSPGQNTGVGSCSLLQGISPTQGSKPGLPHCRWILYHLSHEGSPRILECVAYLFSSRSSTKELNWGLLHCRMICYQLSYFFKLKYS